AGNSVMRLLNLVSDLLDYEKLKAGQMKLVFGPTSAAAVVEESTRAVQPFAQKHRVTIFAREQQDISLVADGERLIRVLINLLSNAVKFSPSGARVEISVHDLDEGFVQFDVSDNGPGIPPEFQGQIFEKYKQAESSGDGRIKGTGLGLPICKAIVEAHYGTIGVESEPYKGSRFWFRVPKAPVSETSMPSAV
ncbi:MAG: sensor histidine kinase, partial [Terriglobales bacterium]